MKLKNQDDVKVTFWAHNPEIGGANPPADITHELNTLSSGSYFIGLRTNQVYLDCEIPCGGLSANFNAFIPPFFKPHGIIHNLNKNTPENRFCANLRYCR